MEFTEYNLNKIKKHLKRSTTSESREVLTKIDELLEYVAVRKHKTQVKDFNESLKQRYEKGN